MNKSRQFWTADAAATRADANGAPVGGVMLDAVDDPDFNPDDVE